ncbi:hypothetical protein Tco_0337483 [Tanacetum coccineum]
MSRTDKGVVYLNQHNRRSLMKLNKVKKFCDGTLKKIQENPIDMVNKNELGQGNKRLRDVIGMIRTSKDLQKCWTRLIKTEARASLRGVGFYVVRRTRRNVFVLVVLGDSRGSNYLFAVDFVSVVAGSLGEVSFSEKDRSANTHKWEETMILYYRSFINEDSRIARETNRLYGEVVVVVEERAQFLQELDALP